jgi:phosphoribosylamine--glycine ligase
LVPADYPEHATPGQVISVDEDAITRQGARVFYASVDVMDGRIVTTASRTVGIVGISDTIDSAEKIAEEATAHVKGPLRHRRDIGTSALIQKRIDHVRSIRVGPTLTKALQVGII